MIAVRLRLYALGFVVLCFVAGCGGDDGPGPGEDAGPGEDGGGMEMDGGEDVDAGPFMCASDADCDDGLYCNGDETCDPTSDRAAYVQLQIGNSLASRVERPDRDQNVTRQALNSFEDLLRIYPTSEEVPEARERMAAMRVKLGEHEFEVARFYYRYGIPVAAVNRLRYLLDTYPDLSRSPSVGRAMRARVRCSRPTGC